MAEFKIGDTVKLKSGGPLMTINAISDNEISCQWFLDKKLNEAKFVPEVLISDNPISFGAINVF